MQKIEGMGSPGIAANSVNFSNVLNQSPYFPHEERDSQKIFFVTQGVNNKDQDFCYSVKHGLAVFLDSFGWMQR